MKMNPEAVEAVEKIYDSYLKGEDVRWVEVINDAIEKSKSGRKKPRSQLERIFLTVCCYFNVKPSDVRSQSRKQEHVWSRMLTTLLLHEAGEKLSTIDTYFGNAPGAAKHNINKATGYIQGNREMKDYLAIKQQLGL